MCLSFLFCRWSHPNGSLAPPAPKTKSDDAVFAVPLGRPGWRTAIPKRIVRGKPRFLWPVRLAPQPQPLLSRCLGDRWQSGPLCGGGVVENAGSHNRGWLASGANPSNRGRLYSAKTCTRSSKHPDLHLGAPLSTGALERGYGPPSMASPQQQRTIRVWRENLGSTVGRSLIGRAPIGCVQPFQGGPLGAHGGLFVDSCGCCNPGVVDEGGAASNEGVSRMNLVRFSRATRRSPRGSIR